MGNGRIRAQQQRLLQAGAIRRGDRRLPRAARCLYHGGLPGHAVLAMEPAGGTVRADRRAPEAPATVTAADPRPLLNRPGRPPWHRNPLISPLKIAGPVR